MRATTRTETKAAERKTGDIKAAQERYGLGRDSLMRIAEDAGAVIRIGRRVLLNFDKIDEYLDSLSGRGGADHDSSV